MRNESSRTTVYRPYLLAAFGSLFLLGFTDNARPPLFGRVLEDLALSDTAGSMMFAATSGGVIAGSAVFRALVQRLGSLRGLQIALIMMGAGIAATGAARGLAVLVLASFSLGVALGGLAIAQNLMVQQAAPPELRRRSLAGLHSLYALASLLVPLAVAALSSAGLRWPRIFILLGFAPAALVLATCAGVRQLPSAAPRPRRAPSGTRRLGLQVGLALMVGCCVVAELLLSTRLPLLLEREGHPDVAALGLAAFFLCLLLSRVGFSVVTVKLSNRAMLMLCAGISGAVFAAGLLWEPRLLPLAALSIGPFFPTAVDLLAEEFGEDLESALSVLFMVVSACVMLGHGAVGRLSDLFSLRQALAVGPGALLATVLLLVALVPRRGDAPEPVGS